MGTKRLLGIKGVGCRHTRKSTIHQNRSNSKMKCPDIICQCEIVLFLLLYRFLSVWTTAEKKNNMNWVRAIKGDYCVCAWLFGNIHTLVLLAPVSVCVCVCACIGEICIRQTTCHSSSKISNDGLEILMNGKTNKAKWTETERKTTQCQNWLWSIALSLRWHAKGMWMNTDEQYYSTE